MEKFGRKDSVTGKGMVEGFCFGDGDFYCESEEDALVKAKEGGFETLKESYDAGNHYWSQWFPEDDEDETWYDEDGKEYTNCHKCGEETIVLEEFTFCTHCLTHL